MEKTKSQSRFRAHVYECIHLAQQIYDVDFGRVTITFDLKGQSMGEASAKPHPTKGRSYFLRFNKEAMQKDWDQMVESTIPHEVAHLVAFADPSLKARQHNRAWKLISISLGDRERGASHHTMTLSPGRRILRYVYEVSGNQLSLSAQQHRNIQKGVAMVCAKTNARIFPSDFAGTQRN